MPSAKISALTALDSTANLAQLYIPLFKADGSPDNPRILASDLLLAADGVNITPAWSGTGTATTPLLVNVTADPGPANASSKLLDLQVGGSTALSVNKAGVFPTNIRTQQAVYIGTSATGSSEASGWHHTLGLNLGTLPLCFGSAGYDRDVYVQRDAADILALRRGNSNQMLRVYEDYTNSTDNFSRGVFGWKLADGTTDSSVLRIGTEKGSLGGTARNVQLITDGFKRLEIAPAGGFDFFNTAGSAVVAGLTASGSWQSSAYETAGPTMSLGTSAGGLRLGSARSILWHSSDANVFGGSNQLGLVMSAANILGITNGSTGGGAIEFTEMTAPATPAANQARVFARDNGSGKTQVCIILPDGVVTVLATQT